MLIDFRALYFRLFPTRTIEHCDHHIQVEADVEEAESSFGAEAFRPSWTMEGRK